MTALDFCDTGSNRATHAILIDVLYGGVGVAKMTADEWLSELAIKIAERLPDAAVQNVNRGCLAIARGRAAAAISATDNMALVNIAVGRSVAPHSAFPHGEPFTLDVNAGTVEPAAMRIVSVIVNSTE